MARLDGNTLRCRCSPVFRGLAAPTTSFTWSAGNWYLVVKCLTSNRFGGGVLNPILVIPSP